MNAKRKLFLLIAVLATAVVGIFANGQLVAGVEGNSTKNNGFIEAPEDCDLSSTGSNEFFILEPGYRLVLTGEGDQGEDIRLAITVQEKTKVVDSVETRVVTEKQVENGEVVEISRNFFAICEQTNDVLYYGEQVDNYVDGKIANHDGSWLAGVDNAREGIIMPGSPFVGLKYKQEVAPGVAMDRAKIVSMDKTVDTPAGTFVDVLKTRETTPLEPGFVEFKYHAPGIGLIQDGDLKLEEYGFI
jgi:hypothetical protein